MDEMKNSTAGSQGGRRCLRRRCGRHSSAPPLSLARVAAPHAWPLTLLRPMAAQAALGAALHRPYRLRPAAPAAVLRQHLSRLAAM
jgi:hypothetical protein